jgi:hypothetical protein
MSRMPAVAQADGVRVVPRPYRPAKPGGRQAQAVLTHGWGWGAGRAVRTPGAQFKPRYRSDASSSRDGSPVTERPALAW